MPDTDPGSRYLHRPGHPGAIISLANPLPGEISPLLRTAATTAYKGLILVKHGHSVTCWVPGLLLHQSLLNHSLKTLCHTQHGYGASLWLCFGYGASLFGYGASRHKCLCSEMPPGWEGGMPHGAPRISALPKPHGNDSLPRGDDRAKSLEKAALAVSPRAPASPAAFRSCAHPRGCISTRTRFLSQANTSSPARDIFAQVKHLRPQVSI